MSRRKDICEITNDFVREYLVEQKKYSNDWLGFRNGLGRIFNKGKTFEKLREIDFDLSKKYIKNLSEKELERDQLDEMLAIITNHILSLNFRVKYITLIITIGVPIYLFFYKNKKVQSGIDWQIISLLLIFVLFGSAMFFERWNINQHSSRYKEIQNIIRCVINKKS